MKLPFRFLIEKAVDNAAVPLPPLSFFSSPHITSYCVSPSPSQKIAAFAFWYFFLLSLFSLGPHLCICMLSLVFSIAAESSLSVFILWWLLSLMGLIPLTNSVVFVHVSGKRDGCWLKPFCSRLTGGRIRPSLKSRLWRCNGAPRSKCPATKKLWKQTWHKQHRRHSLWIQAVFMAL